MHYDSPLALVRVGDQRSVLDDPTPEPTPNQREPTPNQRRVVHATNAETRAVAAFLRG
jgi:hypothetical protein